MKLNRENIDVHTDNVSKVNTNKEWKKLINAKCTNINKEDSEWWIKLYEKKKSTDRVTETIN